MYYITYKHCKAVQFRVRQSNKIFGSGLAQTASVSSQLKATQPPPGVPGTSAVRDENGSATCPVQGPGTSLVATQPLQAPGAELATQPLQAPGAGTATQPTQAPGAGPEVLPTGNESTQLNQSLPGVRPDEFTKESDSEAEVAGFTSYYSRPG